ncbi:MAG: hypothetical protein JEZ03_12515 [Bacteroidales bacterium]|nr:hypothetical protein [Bacteroidales bacterium]
MNSLSIFLISYILIHLIYYGITVFIAYDSQISSILYYNSLEFLVTPDSPEWTYDATVSIIMAGPISCFFVGVGALLLLSGRIILHPTRANIVIWLFFLGFNFSFGQIVNGLLWGSGINNVANLMHVPIEIKYFLSLACIYFLLLTGWHIAPGINNYAEKLNITKRKDQIFYLMSNLLLPWIAGSIIIDIFLNPNYDTQYKIINLYIGFMIIPTFFRPPQKQKQPWNFRKFTPKFHWSFLFIAIAAIFTYYSLLKGGKIFIY